MNVIFCIPYAGGAASAYGELKTIAEKRNLRLVPLELAGHSSRLAEAPYRDFSEAVEDCYRMIADYLHRNYERTMLFLAIAWEVGSPMNWWKN